jgi:hypothetical protein
LFFFSSLSSSSSLPDSSEELDEPEDDEAEDEDEELDSSVYLRFFVGGGVIFADFFEGDTRFLVASMFALWLLTQSLCADEDGW